MEALNLTAEQRAQLKQQHFTQSVAAEKLHSDMRIKHMELQQLMSAETMDRPKVDAKMKELSDLRLQAQKSRLDQRDALMKVLTPEQKTKLKELRRPGDGPGGFAPGMRGPGPRPRQEQEQ
jgi:Spy/CpxP family protein refolding chaperone